MDEILGVLIILKGSFVYFYNSQIKQHGKELSLLLSDIKE